MPKKTKKQDKGLKPLVPTEATGATFAETLRRRIVAVTPVGGTFHADAVTFGDEGKRVSHWLSDALKRGEVERVERGLYRYLGRDQKPGRRGAPNIRLALWRVLRARRIVSFPELVELAHASPDYTREVMAEFVAAGAARQFGAPAKNMWKLSTAAVEMPPAVKNAARLRGLRERKKMVLTALDNAATALDRARQQLELLEEPVEE